MEILRATEEKKWRIAWKFLNEITGWKDSNQGKLKTENPEKRVKLWNGSFEKLLCPTAINTTSSPTRAIIGRILPINTNNQQFWNEITKQINEANPD